MARRRRNESPIEILLGLPWQVSMVLAVIAYICVKWVFPALAASNMFLKPITAVLAGGAWIFAGFFVLTGLAAFGIEKAKAAKAAKNEGTRRGVADGGSTRLSSSGRGVADRGLQRERRQPTVADPDQVLPPTLASAPPVKAPTLPRPTEWSLELIRDIEWKRFEDLCQRFYEIKGIRSETTALGPDGGIDIRLYQDDTGRATSIVQCKAWGERFVGVKPVRELLGVMTHEKIGKAFFMTSGRFSDDAREVAQSNRITLIDGQRLLLMIKRLPDESQTALLDYATSGDYITPTCPSCGIKMRPVEGKEGKPTFWGCAQFPRCRQTLGMRRSSALQGGLPATTY